MIHFGEAVPKVLDARRHTVLDYLTAGTFLAPRETRLGFAADPEAQAFHGQALLEGGVIAATDGNPA
jgi:hypothetical protein